MTSAEVRRALCQSEVRTQIVTERKRGKESGSVSDKKEQIRGFIHTGLADNTKGFADAGLNSSRFLNARFNTSDASQIGFDTSGVKGLRFRGEGDEVGGGWRGRGRWLEAEAHPQDEDEDEVDVWRIGECLSAVED